MVVDGKTTGTYDAVIHIIYGDRGKTIYLVADGTEDDKFLCLDDCLDIIGYEGEGRVIVIIEDPLKGKVYQYGNYAEKCWEEIGETQGYA